jgi:hypothetical protein
MTDFEHDLVEFAQTSMFAPPLRHPIHARHGANIEVLEKDS